MPNTIREYAERVANAEGADGIANALTRFAYAILDVYPEPIKHDEPEPLADWEYVLLHRDTVSEFIRRADTKTLSDVSLALLRVLAQDRA